MEGRMIKRRKRMKKSMRELMKSRLNRNMLTRPEIRDLRTTYRARRMRKTAITWKIRTKLARPTSKREDHADRETKCTTHDARPEFELSVATSSRTRRTSTMKSPLNS